ncbi:MAG: 5-(carboxyamino)imidazole ribonucleotide synthase [Flammeovirgaceae bacterium]|jgi:5-(carboxyamino)imidazole ribonucleotide synthase
MKAFSRTKVGVLGGGQLGRMLIQSGINFDIQFKMLDSDAQAPCAQIAQEFVHGSLMDFKTVVKFGQELDVLTIEIEKVNADALEELEKQGKKVFPQSHIIRMIQDKRLQKQFYKDNKIPTSDFVLIDSLKELDNYSDWLPAVQKLGRDGYDGRGVQMMRTPSDFKKGFEEPSLLEKMVEMEKEIAIIVSRNEAGEIKTFPAVELVYHPEHNLVDYLISPADIPAEIEQKAKEITIDLVEKLSFVGILAVELFWAKSGEILVNEIAPRPHNSGHQTIEGNYTSQYEQHLRAILNLPLGNTEIRQVSAMINILGEEGYTGKAKYVGMDEILKMEGVYPHLYGKEITKPFRKMGHVTILGKNREDVSQKIEHIRNNLKVISQ